MASYFAYFVWQPSHFKNYGELLQPTAIPELTAVQTDPADAVMIPPKGHWTLVMVDAGACDAACRTKLWQIRQLRLTQGKDADRVSRAWVIDDGATPSADLRRDYAGTVLVSGLDGKLTARLPAERSPRDHLYLVDPLGNLMMRFPRDADPNRIKKDLIHLLKVSRIG
ncbi:MAG: cytochrome C oxidase subunit I [Burkholderiales bacterium]|nr:cytochrome C oxidase subunit I [Burkholderiales bacterium]